MTFFALEDYEPMSRGRCAGCRKIANQEPPAFLCAKCRRWAKPGIGPTPLAREIAEPYMLQDPGYVEDQYDPREMSEILLDALDAPGIQESLEFVAQHRNHDCSHYDKCLNMALFQQWFFFSCAGCALFGKK